MIKRGIPNIPWYAIKIRSRTSVGSISEDVSISTWEALEIADFQANRRSVSKEIRRGIVFGWSFVYRDDIDSRGRKLYTVSFYFNPFYGILAAVR